MSWTKDVACSKCLDFDNTWSVVNGVWTCQCGQPMSVSAIAAMHKVYADRA